MEAGNRQASDRAIGGWLIVAAVGALLPWQSSYSSLRCGAGGVCGGISGPGSLYSYPLQSGPGSVFFWSWIVFVVAVSVGVVVYEVDRHGSEQMIRVLSRFDDRMYQAVGAVMLVAAFVSAGTSVSTVSPGPSPGNAVPVTTSTGPTFLIWVAIISAIALCRGGFLFAGLTGSGRVLKRLLFDPTRYS